MKYNYIRCVRCENDYTSDLHYGLCENCKDAIAEDYESYLNGEDGEDFDMEFCKQFANVNEIYETYRKSMLSNIDEVKYVDDDNIELRYTDLGEYDILIEYMLDNDIVIMAEYDDFGEMKNCDLDHWVILLDMCLNDIEDNLDDLWNMRDVCDNDKYARDFYLRKVRYLAELKKEVLENEIQIK